MRTPRSTPAAESSCFAVVPFSSTRARSKCSVDTYASPSALASSSARSSTRDTSRDSVGSAVVPDCFGDRSIARSVSALSCVTFSPAFWSRGTTVPSSCESKARKRWASLMTGLPRARASALACCSASAAFTVKRSGLIIVVYGGSPTPKATSVPEKNAVLAGKNPPHLTGRELRLRLDARALNRSETHVERSAGHAVSANPWRDARARGRSRPPREAIHPEQDRRRTHAAVEQPERPP